MSPFVKCFHYDDQFPAINQFLICQNTVFITAREGGGGGGGMGYSCTRLSPEYLSCHNHNVAHMILKVHRV